MTECRAVDAAVGIPLFQYRGAGGFQRVAAKGLANKETLLTVLSFSFFFEGQSGVPFQSDKQNLEINKNNHNCCQPDSLNSV